ncbi:hypothetical protein INT44_004718 [Umbelopsis vinacea]|uniref:Uncharacterized protein n=1 Tax=Umbelopsis vinacea TaxID=44442 RepID=A0A8H7PFG5_9FUNG|nr:hypothetical protein INT44_004718 [Umbelopsis vinacea]
MHKILHYTDLQWAQSTSYHNGTIEKLYKELADDDKKNYDALVEGAFKAKYLNPERYKLEQTRLESPQHVDHACQKKADEQTTDSKYVLLIGIAAPFAFVLVVKLLYALASWDIFKTFSRK